MLFNSRTRIALAIVAFLSAFFGPAIFTFLCMGLQAAFFRAWEAIAIGAIADLVFLPAGSFLHPAPLFTIAAIVLVWGLEPIRNEFLVQE